MILGKKKKFLELYDNNKVLVVGAGALGNFVGMLLARIGVNNINIIDPDTIEATNLNRQILFYDAVDKNKAKVLADRLNKINPNSSYGIVGKIDKSYKKIKKYDIVFDCVDNFETRIVLSNLCKSNGTILISGGTDYKSGQVVTYVPGFTKTPREILNLDKIVEQRPKKEIETTEAGCLYQPDPSVIMSNQIVAGLMVNEFRKITHPLFFDDITRGMIKYDSEADKRISKIIIK